MPLTWYQIGDGPAPWSNATSYSSSYDDTLSSSDSVFLSWAGSTMSSYTQEAQYKQEYSSKDNVFDSNDTYSNFQSNFGGTYYTHSDYNQTITSSFSASQTTSRSFINFHQDFSFISLANEKEYQFSDSVGIVSHSIETHNGSASYFFKTDYIGGETASYYYSYITVENGGMTLSQRYGTYIGTFPFTTFTYSTQVDTASTGITNTYYTSSTYLISTLSANTSTALFSVESNIRVSTTETQYTTQIISTILSSDTGTDTSTYVSTSYDNTTWTITTVGISPITSFVPQGVSSTYSPNYQYIAPVISALPSEYLFEFKTTANGFLAASSDLEEFRVKTFGSWKFSGSEGSPFTLSIGTDSSSNFHHTVTYFLALASTIAQNSSKNLFATVTQYGFNGEIPTPESLSYTQVISLPTPTTTAFNIQNITTSTATASGARTYSKWTKLTFDTTTSINKIGWDQNQNSYLFTMASLINSYSIVSYASWRGNAGETVSTYASPAGWNINTSVGNMTQERLRLIGGYQGSEIGSNQNVGKYLDALISFYIGYQSAQGARESNNTPVDYSTSATTSDSSYFFSLGSNSYWSVTVLADITTTSFSANVATIGGNGGYFALENNGGTQAGGGFPHENQVQYATLSNALDWRYTLRDSAGTSSYSTQLNVSFFTLDISSKIMAIQGLPATIASPDMTQAGYGTYTSISAVNGELY